MATCLMFYVVSDVFLSRKYVIDVLSNAFVYFVSLLWLQSWKRKTYQQKKEAKLVYAF